MPRKARLVVPGLSHHIMQTGHNGQVVFRDDTDYKEYLSEACRQAQALPVEIQGWCLLSGETHLLLFCPPGNDEKISLFMQQLAGHYTRYFNGRYGGGGTIWQDRFRCSPVQPGQWRLALVRYMECLPVFHDIVENPKSYLWSSHKARMGCIHTRMLKLDADYQALGETSEERRQVFKDFLSLGCGGGERKLIETAVARDVVTGDDHFADDIAEKTGKPVTNRGPGRPPNHGGERD